MRKVILMVGTLLALTATLAMASGTELSWNACYGQAGTVSLRTSASYNFV